MIPKGGMRTTFSVNVSIKVLCGPVCHSMADLKMFTKILNGHPFAEYDASFVPIPWREIQSPTKLIIGMLEFDGVCMPHPPILRALRETVTKLDAASHEGVHTSIQHIFYSESQQSFSRSGELPFDYWEVALTTWKLYFQTGAADV